MTEVTASLLRSLPSVSKFLTGEVGSCLCQEFGEGVVKLELRELIERFRCEIKEGTRGSLPDEREFGRVLKGRLVRLVSARGKQAINATGVVLHTGLGRAPLSDSALKMAQTGTKYSVVQVDLESGGRSKRDEHIERMLKELTGCEAAAVINNNAAATLIILNTLASGREVIISRGQLVEIGGSFRIPEVMAQSGARLREVGTTNRTHLRDYESAICEDTAAILYVHPSNYEIQGFSGTPSIEELVALGRKHDLPVIADLGSGALVELEQFGLRSAYTIRKAISDGAFVTCSSGDKLIGGPQAGIICGASEVVSKIRKNPYARMFRVGKFTLGAMQATLVHYINGDYCEQIPLYRMLSLKLEQLQQKGTRFVQCLGEIEGCTLRVADSAAFVGGGSLPTQSIPSKVVCLEYKDTAKRSVFSEQLTKALRLNTPPVFARVNDERVYFDMRTVFPDEIEELARIIRLVIDSFASV